ncbi:MAG: hypothetical protein DRN71_05955 [Candidatus Nanohalarchaeota archaeon]|nr:MAG: hypothetical protein DRN71_05955 [Candidatus Nanohaloarchaeota archaeon]
MFLKMLFLKCFVSSSVVLVILNEKRIRWLVDLVVKVTIVEDITISWHLHAQLFGKAKNGQISSPYA